MTSDEALGPVGYASGLAIGAGISRPGQQPIDLAGLYAKYGTGPLTQAQVDQLIHEWTRRTENDCRD